MGLFDKVIKLASSGRKAQKRRGRGLTAGTGAGQGERAQTRQRAIDSEVERMVRGQSTDAENSRY